MKKFYKVSTVAVCACLTFSALAGCGRPSKEGYDDAKTQLFVYNYNGGVGTDWLYNIIEDFQVVYKDYKLGEKVGVEVVVEPNKIKDSDILGNVEGSLNEIFITEGTNYYDVVNQGLARDITSMISATNTDGKTILSKFTDVESDYYKANGKYYALPHVYMPYGISYNEQIFEDYKLYFAKNGCPSERLQQNGSFTKYAYSNNKDANEGNLSAGPDGKYGTYDDGLPATYEEFYVMMDHMLEVGVTPFIYTGSYESPYMNWLAGRLAMDYEGEDNLKVLMSREGVLKETFVESISDDGTLQLAEEYTVGASNQAAVKHTAGLYHALSFIEKIYSNSAYSATRRPGNGTLTHTGAQQEFLVSAQTSYTENPIAMLIEGSWWENESIIYKNYDKVAGQGGQTHEEFRIKFMAMPHATEAKIGSNPISGECINSFMFINSKIESSKVELAEAFLKFCYADENLRKFHTDTNVFKAVEYELEPSDYSQLSYFGKSVYDYISASGKFYQCAPTEAFLNSPERINNWFVTGRTTSVTSIRTAGTKAVDYFKGILALNPLK